MNNHTHHTYRTLSGRLQSLAARICTTTRDTNHRTFAGLIALWSIAAALIYFWRGE